MKKNKGLLNQNTSRYSNQQTILDELERERALDIKEKATNANTLSLAASESVQSSFLDQQQENLNILN